MDFSHFDCFSPGTHFYTSRLPILVNHFSSPRFLGSCSSDDEDEMAPLYSNGQFAGNCWMRTQQQRTSPTEEEEEQDDDDEEEFHKVPTQQGEEQQRDMGSGSQQMGSHL
jgi:hypothetical protein